MKFLKAFSLVLITVIFIPTLLCLTYTASIKTTLLNQRFVEKELGKLNFYSTFKNSIAGKNEDATGVDKIIEEIVYASISEEWLKSQTNSVLSNLYDYINGKTEDPNLKISFSEIKPEIKNNLLNEIDNLIPPEIKNNPQEVEMFKSNFETQIIEDIDTKLPDEIDLIVDSQNDIQALSTLKNYVHLFNLSFYGLIAFKAFLVVLTALLLRKIKIIFRFMGGNYLAAGVILFLVNTLTKFNFASGIQKAELPPMLEKEAVLGLFSDILAPVNMYNIIIVVTGILLLALSFVKFSAKKEQAKTNLVETSTN
ncbi:MAG TPA: hypothetical protein ENN38_05660 [Actinobacteria bacterium]|nr:hypothetical protein [Actinomycetota bacterium]